MGRTAGSNLDDVTKKRIIQLLNMDIPGFTDIKNGGSPLKKISPTSAIYGSTGTGAVAKNMRQASSSVLFALSLDLENRLASYFLGNTSKPPFFKVGRVSSRSCRGEDEFVVYDER